MRLTSLILAFAFVLGGPTLGGPTLAGTADGPTPAIGSFTFIGTVGGPAVMVMASVR